MVEHQVIYSPERKTMVIDEYFESLPLNYSILEVAIFSLCRPLTLLRHVRNRFLFVSTHGSPISDGFQLTLFTRAGRVRPFFPPFLQTCSRKLWIEATAHFPVGHTYFLLVECVALPRHTYFLLVECVALPGI